MKSFTLTHQVRAAPRARPDQTALWHVSQPAATAVTAVTLIAVAVSWETGGSAAGLVTIYSTWTRRLREQKKCVCLQIHLSGNPLISCFSCRYEARFCCGTAVCLVYRGESTANCGLKKIICRAQNSASSLQVSQENAENSILMIALQ